MTDEDQWIHCNSLDNLIDVCWRVAPDATHKVRLLCARVCRFAMEHIHDPLLAEIVESVERLTEEQFLGQLSKLQQQLLQHEQSLSNLDLVAQLSLFDLNQAIWALLEIDLNEQGVLVCCEHSILEEYNLEERIDWNFFVPIARDIFGNPFRPVTFDPRWRTATTVGVAQTMYDSRDFGAMPILADALQDTGCEHADILSHCRSDGPHVRGCWVVDLVLGKE